MRLLYLWHGTPREPFVFEGSRRPPDELYVEEAARAMGIEVTRSFYQDPEVEAKVEALKPEIILFSHPPGGRSPDPPSLALRLRQVSPESVQILLCFDLTSFQVWEPDREKRYERMISHMDIFCGKEDGRKQIWKERGGRHFRAVQGHHPWVEKVWEPSSTSPDPRPVAFFGSWSPRRDAILGALQRQLGNDLVVLSQTGRWKEVQGVRPPIFGTDRSEFLKGVSCVVDVSNGSDIAGYHSDRVEDVLASGVPLITDASSESPIDFVHRKHLLRCTFDGNWDEWIRILRGDASLAKTLSEEGSRRVRLYHGYDQTVREVLIARERFLDYVEEVRPIRNGTALKRKRVLVLGQWRPQGLGYIARRIVEVVEGAGGTVRVASINRNPTWDEEHQYDRDAVPPEGTEAIIFLEKADDRWLEWAKARGVLTVYFPMWEFFRPDPEIRWAKAADIVAAVPWQEVQAALGRPVRPVVWDPGLEPLRPVHLDPIVLFHDARGIEQGKYDLRPRQHTEIVLRAFKRAHRELGKSIQMIVRVKNNPLSWAPEDVTQFTADLTRAYFHAAVQQVSAVICPSGPEGFGLPPYEYQALGSPPVVLGVPPSTSCVTHEVDGLHVKVVDGGECGLARKWSPDEDSLVEAMVRLGSEEGLVEHLQEGCFQTALSRRGAFEKFLSGILNE